MKIPIGQAVRYWACCGSRIVAHIGDSLKQESKLDSESFDGRYIMQRKKAQKTLLLADLLARWSIGLLFLCAGVPKLFNVHEFAKTINAYAILPAVLIPPAAIVLPVIEIILAVGLVFNKRESKIGSAVLLLLFISLLFYAIWAGLDIDCGCFGPEDPEFSAFYGLRQALLRDIMMLFLLAYSFWYHRFRYLNFKNQGEERQ